MAHPVIKSSIALVRIQSYLGQNCDAKDNKYVLSLIRSGLNLPISSLKAIQINYFRSFEIRFNKMSYIHKASKAMVMIVF